MGVILGHAKFQLSTPRGTFSNWCWMKGVGKICVFQMENRLYLGNGERYGL